MLFIALFCNDNKLEFRVIVGIDQTLIGSDMDLCFLLMTVSLSIVAHNMSSLMQLVSAALVLWLRNDITKFGLYQPS